MGRIKNTKVTENLILETEHSIWDPKLISVSQWRIIMKSTSRHSWKKKNRVLLCILQKVSCSEIHIYVKKSIFKYYFGMLFWINVNKEIALLEKRNHDSYPLTEASELFITCGGKKKPATTKQNKIPTSFHIQKHGEKIPKTKYHGYMIWYDMRTSSYPCCSHLLDSKDADVSCCMGSKIESGSVLMRLNYVISWTVITRISTII